MSKMVGHITKDGYEGYNSTPSSPTKYTINRPQRGDGGRKFIVSRLCILLTALLFVLALVVVFLCTYYLSTKKCPLESCDRAELKHSENGNFIFKTEAPKVINLTNDRIEIYPFETTIGDDFSFTTEDNFISDEEVFNKNYSLYKLPHDNLPSSYSVKIIPSIDENNLTTYGSVNITIKCMKVNKQITLNLKHLDIDDEDVQVHSKESFEYIDIDKIIRLPDYDRLNIILKEDLVEDEEYFVSIVFRGKIRDIPNGFYRSSYVDSITKKTGWIFNTLFSPTYARYVYPCFDEPSFKAKFAFSIGRPSDMISLSNMKIFKSEPIHGMDEWIWDHYYETPMMSTYLTAFLIAPEKALMQNKADSVYPEISLWARQDGALQTQFPIKLSESILNFFENYFEIQFPLSKIDIVGVPSHEYNAMENWGLIIFREGILLVDERNSIESQQSLALTLAHEFAHQWFGNLVTPAWWDDLWLKEGFSSYFQCLVIDYIKPDWLIFEGFILNEMKSALQQDALMSAPAISKEVFKPNKEIFNIISYHKGSSVIRMMANFIDSRQLKSGLVSYLRKYSYSNATQEDLWSTLTQEGYLYDQNKTVPLKTIMDSWILQAGFPVINVIRNYNDDIAEITQERFLFNGKKDDSHLWWVPISYTTKEERDFNNTLPKVWLAQEKKKTLTDMPKKDEWLLVNLKNTGFYRVNYDTENWIMLINDFINLPNIIKAQLISDSLNLARAGKLNYEVALSMTIQLTKENDYLPWKAATDSLRYLRNALIKMPAYGNFRKYVITIMWRVYSYILIEDPNELVPWKVPSDPVPQMLSEDVVGMACLLENSHCVNTARLLFDIWLKSPEEGNIIPESIRPIIYCAAIKAGGSKEWEFAYERFHNATLKGARFDDEQYNLIHAMGCPSEQWLITRALSLIIQPYSGLSKEEGIHLFKSVASNNVGHWFATSFIRTEWKYLIKYYNSPSVVYEMISSIVLYIDTPYDVKLLKDLIEEIKEYTKEDSLVLKQALEVAENNIIWMKLNYVTVERWLQIFTQKFSMAMDFN